MRVWCDHCKKYTEHFTVSPSLDEVNGWKCDIQTQGGCRDSRADYKTTQCDECKLISTGDFATD